MSFLSSCQSKQTAPVGSCLSRFIFGLAVFVTTAAAWMFAGAAPAHAQDKDEAQANALGGFPELETKYIFGNFTVGSSTGIEGEKAFEPETQANFGKGGGGDIPSAQPP